AALVRGVIRRNGGDLRNDYYDDLAWMGLALGRAQAVAGVPAQDLVAALWAQVRDGWDAEHGGIRWRRDAAYTNAPANGPGGVLPDEGGTDRALFKGIYARYAARLDDPGLVAALAANGEAAWAARSAEGLFGPSWTQPPGAEVELSAHLSGVLLLAALAAADR